MFFYLNEEEQELCQKVYTPLTEVVYKTEKERKIVELYKQGFSMQDIEDEVSVSRGLIDTVLNNHKVPKRKNSRVLQNKISHILEDEGLIRALITDYYKLSLQEIYTKYAIHKNGLYYILDLYDVARKSDLKAEALKDEDPEDIPVE